VALDDEEVITRTDPRHRWNLAAAGGGYGAAPNVTVRVVNNGSPVSAKQGATTSDGRGGFNVEVILDQIDEGLAQRAANGRGKFIGALQGSYDLRRRPR
jgi:hypothetical protein